MLRSHWLRSDDSEMLKTRYVQLHPCKESRRGSEGTRRFLIRANIGEPMGYFLFLLGLGLSLPFYAAYLSAPRERASTSALERECCLIARGTNGRAAFRLVLISGGSRIPRSAIQAVSQVRPR